LSRYNRVPDKELDQIASWLKLSGIVRRHDGLLRVRNAIYEHVFDQRWARVHRRLHVNWRRRLARAAAALLVVIVLVTIPLAIYALRQKAVADVARRQAEVQRDEAEHQRDETERQLLTTQRNLQTAQEAVEALKTFDPKAAAQLSTELATASTAADKELRALTEERERLRRERDEALASVQKLSQDNAGLRQNQQRAAPAAAAPASEPSVTVPNLVGRGLGDADAELRTLGLLANTRVVDGDMARGTIVVQSPRPGSAVTPGSVVLLSIAAGPDGEARVRDTAQATQSTSDDALQLVRVLQRYKAGYEALDAKAIAAVNPTVNVASLQSALNQLSKLSYDVKLHVDGIVIAPDGQTASVTASETYRSTPKIGSASPQTGTAVFTMRKTGARN
jgi:PASTA domain